MYEATTDTRGNEITLNTKVRSFDFEGRDLTGERACYVEGTVVGYAMVEGCERYVVFITREVFGGEPRESGRTHIYPPKNGVKDLLFRKGCDGVEAIFVETPEEKKRWDDWAHKD